MFENLNAAIGASDKDFKVIYQNKKCQELFKKVFGRSDFIGAEIHECHSPATSEKIKKYYQEYTEKNRDLDYYVVNGASGKVTVVNVPFYKGGQFSGIVEFIFNSALL